MKGLRVDRWVGSAAQSLAVFFFLQQNPQQETSPAPSWSVTACFFPATLPTKVLRVELTIEPPGVVLVCAHGRLLSKSAEDGCISAHKIDVHACVELLICGRVRVSVSGRSGSVTPRQSTGLPLSCPGHNHYRLVFTTGSGRRPVSGNSQFP